MKNIKAYLRQQNEISKNNNHRTNPGKKERAQAIYICLADSNCDPGQYLSEWAIWPLPVLYCSSKQHFGVSVIAHSWHS